MNDRDQPITGMDAYETAWDTVAKNLWSVINYNVLWFGCVVLGTLALFMVCFMDLDKWGWFLASPAVFLMFVLPLWESANILRYGADPDGLPKRGNTLPVVDILLARLLFILVVAPAYLLFVLPGIYLHLRLALYLPVLLRSTDPNPIKSLSRSWLLSRSHFVKLYTLWIAVVVSHTVALLPFGLGLILRQPVNGLAKDSMFLSCSNRPRDGPIELKESKGKTTS